jgi:hypothetical protein
MFGSLSTNLKKELFGNNLNSSANCVNGHKKIKDYSYNLVDRIGKGFSSIVYKGVNEITSTDILRHDPGHALYWFGWAYVR